MAPIVFENAVIARAADGWVLVATMANGDVVAILRCPLETAERMCRDLVSLLETETTRELDDAQDP